MSELFFYLFVFGKYLENLIMNLAIPQNIYTALFAMTLPDELKEKVNVRASSLITKELKEGKCDVGLIPSCDLLTHKDLFISKSYGLSFDGALSNSYIYFVPEQQNLSKILLRGDISSNDLILSKILFSEQYNIKMEFSIDTSVIDFEKNNYLIAGLENNQYAVAQNGVSFADQLAELIDFPYVNFVLASTNDEKLKDFTSRLGKIDDNVTSNINTLINKLGIDTKLQTLIRENKESVYFDLTENEIDGLKEQIKLAYYHGFIEDINELNFV